MKISRINFCFFCWLWACIGSRCMCLYICPTGRLLLSATLMSGNRSTMCKLHSYFRMKHWILPASHFTLFESSICFISDCKALYHRSGLHRKSNYLGRQTLMKVVAVLLGGVTVNSYFSFESSPWWSEKIRLFWQILKSALRQATCPGWNLCKICPFHTSWRVLSNFTELFFQIRFIVGFAEG